MYTKIPVSSKDTTENIPRSTCTVDEGNDNNINTYTKQKLEHAVPARELGAGTARN